MNKESLKKRLLEAGIEEDVVDARLKEVDDAILKELTDIPEATLLKELGMEKKKEGKGKKTMPAMTEDAEDDEDEEEEEVVEKEDVLYFPEETLTDIAQAVKKEFEGAVFEFDITNDPEFVALKEQVDKLVGLVEESNATLKEFMGEGAPRANRLRVKRHKESRQDDEDDVEVTPEAAKWIKSLHDKAQAQTNPSNGVVVGADGKTYPTMSDMLRSAAQ